MRRRALGFAAALSLALTSPGSALAEGPAEAPAAPSALELAREGVTLYEAGRWAEAEARFTAAEALTHSPVFVLYVGRAQRSAGRLLAARESLRRVASEQVAADAPPPWKQAQADARAELAALEPTIPSVVVRAPPGSRATIDGTAVELGQPVPLDPGRHRVVATTPLGERSAEIDLRLGERAREVRLDAGATPAPPPERDVSPPAAPAERAPGSLLPGAVVLGLGAVGLGVGAATGLLALGASGDVEDLCPGGVCRASDEPEVETARSDAGTLADVSTVAFVAGGVLAATGVVLLVVRPFGREDPARISVGPGGARWQGTF